MNGTTPVQIDAVLQAHAMRLYAARRDGVTTDLVTLTSPEITAPDAHRIAQATLALWGQPRCGFKLGYTSAAMRRQMGISQPNYGRLTVDMDFTRGNPVPLVHPRAEPEIALRIARDVDPRADKGADVITIVDAVFPALEIVDTRYHDYVFRYEDNIADNSSAAGFVLGAAHLPDVLRGDGVDVTFEIGEERPLIGHSSAALGGPLHALKWLLAELAAIDEVLPAGSIILTGGLTAAPPLAEGQTLTAHFQTLGPVSVTRS